MLKKNNHGFAITTLIYGLSLMGMSIVLLLMAIMAINRNNTSDFVRQIEEELTHMSAVSGVMTAPTSYDYENPNVIFGIEIPGVNRESFESIVTLDHNVVPANADHIFDVSYTKNGSIMAWYLDEDSNGLYELYIGQNGGVVAPSDCQFLFRNYTNLKLLDLSHFDTFTATTMSQMFEFAGYNSNEFQIIFGDQFSTSNVTTMRSMFSDCGFVADPFVLDLRGVNFDTSKVTDMTSMFQHAGFGAWGSSLFELYLGNQFDTSNVVSMDTMFNDCGRNHASFVLDLGNKFNTSKVENMSAMFSGTANRSTNITFDLGSRFYTPNVTNMSYMFYQIAANDPSFELDLSSFDFSKVESSEQMLNDMNANAQIYVQNASQRDWIINGPGFSEDRIHIK